MKPSMARTYENLIAGRWVASSSGETFDSINPADTSDIVGRFQQSTTEDARRAIEAAREAYPSWSEASPSRRAEILHRAAQLIEADASDLARLLTREEGKTLAESTAEVKRAAA
ncbi:MAG TPA: aldehyde dehydrogenase family protein, partial [Blastocatellia bacterium]|nr:aldehyde dehydrogenase family protein [Blastocatellia bacterium]